MDESQPSLSSLLKERPLKFILHVFIENDGTEIQRDKPLKWFAACTESSGCDKITASLFCKHQHLLFGSFFCFFFNKKERKKQNWVQRFKR